MIELIDYSVDLGTFKLSDINLKLDIGQVLMVVGSSGSGKTVFLESLIGRYKNGGKLIMDNKDISNLKPEERDISIVYQSYELFDFMNLEDNIRFPLKFKKTNVDIEDIMKNLNLNDLKSRSIMDLSGGEKQRAALARALVCKPSLLLLDEPLSSLDYINKKTAAMLIKDMLKKYNITAIYVSHDPNEFIDACDKVAIFDHGKIKKICKVEEFDLDDYIQ